MSTTNPDAKASGTDAPATSCDGVGTTAGSAKVDIATYPFHSNLTACDPKTMTSFPKIIGVLDNYTVYMGTQTVHVLQPATCNDVAGNEPSGTDPGAGKSTCSTPPAGAPTLATVTATKTAWTGSGNVTIFGVVTAVNTFATGKSSTFYIQDQIGTMNAGIEVYVPKAVTLTAAAPQVNLGDLVEVDGAESVYPAASGNILGSKQITATMIKGWDTGCQLPAAATMSGSWITDDSMNTQFEGMRVLQNSALTADSTCPAELTYGG
jgi:predicted extracellular nuclease